MKENRWTVIRWLVRTASAISIFLLILFFVGEGVDVQKVAPKEWIGLLLFPLGVAAGMLIGWRNELTGGIISSASLFLFYFGYGLGLSHQWPGGVAFLVFASPGILFLILGAWSQLRKKTITLPK